MSKKKSFSGSTMTLKDFHGGSIPSDLPLPSAPGVSVRPPDRWGPSGPGIRPASDVHHRPRPGSAGGSGPRTGSGFPAAEERGSPFLSTPANIGRHFDEDERKPFDASASFPRRSPPPPSESVARPASATTVATRSDPKPQQLRPVAGPVANAWGLKKEPALDPAPQAVQVSNLSSRFAQASAVEKVTSGRWQTSPVGPQAVDAERFQETVRVVDEGSASLPMQREVKVVRPVSREEREVKEVRPVSREGRFGGGASGSQLYLQGVKVSVGVDLEERPKLKLLPRMKLVEASEVRVMDEKQGNQPSSDPVRMQSAREIQGNTNMPRPVSAGADAEVRLTERPRLNLKPRSLPVEQVVESAERERKSVFGGARPRELVLKERGKDENIVSTNVEAPAPANMIRGDSPKTDMKQKLEPPTQATKRTERSNTFPSEQRSGRDIERKESRPDIEKVDNQRASWRSDNRKNSRESEKPVERRPEPETWRKPVEEPKPEAAPGAPRLGKAASALELAQAFSRPVSDPRSDSRFSTQRSMPGRVQVPFSRLTDTRELYPASTNPRQINGY